MSTCACMHLVRMFNVSSPCVLRASVALYTVKATALIDYRLSAARSDVGCIEIDMALFYCVTRRPTSTIPLYAVQKKSYMRVVQWRLLALS